MGKLNLSVLPADFDMSEIHDERELAAETLDRKKISGKL